MDNGTLAFDNIGLLGMYWRLCERSDAPFVNTGTVSVQAGALIWRVAVLRPLAVLLLLRPVLPLDFVNQGNTHVHTKAAAARSADRVPSRWTAADSTKRLGTDFDGAVSMTIFMDDLALTGNTTGPGAFSQSDDITQSPDQECSRSPVARC